MNKIKTVGFMGLGKLGLPVSFCIESKGYKVLGYDKNPDVAQYIKTKKLPFKEKGIEPYLENTKLEMVDVEELVKQSDLIFCAVQTPHDREYEGVTRIPEKRIDFNYSYLISAVEDIVGIAEKLQKPTRLAIISTVLPGTLKRFIKPMLGKYVKLVYTPQFIAMGTVIDDYLNPEFNLIGVDDSELGYEMRDFYATINDAPPLLTDVNTAEGIKVSYNTLITTKTVLANIWGELAHKLDMNVDDIYRAWSLSTKRLLSNRYLKSGVGDGGGCFPAGELVMTINGMRPIETIKAGDLVLTHDGSFQKVVKLWERDYDGELVTTQVRGLPKVRMTVEHPVLVRKDGRPRVPDGRRNTYHKIIDKLHPVKELRADRLTLDSMLAWPKLKKISSYAISNRSFTYLAGWYLAEGSIDGGRIRFDLHKHEAKDARDIETWLKDCRHTRTDNKGKTAKVVHKVEGNRRSIRFGNKGLADELVSKFGNGSATKQIPAGFLWGHIADAEALLWGLIRGDGHRGKNGISYSTISRDLAWGVFTILHRLELNPTLREIPPRGNHKKAYEVRVRNRRQASRLCEIVGWKPYDYDKDIQTYADDGGNVWRHVQKLEKETYKGKVYNLWVEKNHTYVVGCGAVHNCHPRDNIALSYLAQRTKLSFDIFDSLMKARENHMDWIADLAAFAHNSKTYKSHIVILGRSFKPETNIETGSSAILLANLLKERGLEYDHIDPVEEDIPAGTMFSEGVYVIGTAHEIIRSYNFASDSIVIDPFGIVSDQSGVEVIRLGRA